MRYLKTLFVPLILIFSIIDLQGQAIFTLENTTANMGETLCVDVTAENLVQVQSMQFSINYDPLVLDFVSINNLATPFATANITPNSSLGQVGFSWFAGASAGATLPANDVLFEICFTVVGNVGVSTDISFTNNPTFIEVVTVGSNGTNIGLTVIGGGGGPSSLQPLLINIPDVTYSSGVSFCVPVSASNLTGIISIQFTIEWDPDIIQFDSVTAFNIPELDAADFGTTNIAQGNIAFSWYDNNLVGVTLPDDTEIFQMCFTVIGDPNDITQIEITDDPVPIEVIEGGMNMDIGLIPSGGVVTVLQSLFITNADITGTSCYDSLAGGIDITIAGGLTPYSYMWSTGATTQDLAEIEAGTYTVTILDSNNPTNSKIETYTVPGDFQVPIADAGADTLLNCNDPVLVIDGSGSGTGTGITYLWTGTTGNIQNETTLTPSVNSTGVYTLLVTDTLNGCSATDFIVVGGTAVPPAVDAGDGGEITCQNTEITLTGSVDPASTDYTYQWTNVTTGVVVNNSNSLSTTVNQSGLYEFLVTDLSGCSAFDTVSVIANASFPMASAGSEMVLNCEDVEIMLDGSLSASGNNITYLWTSNNSSIIQNPTTVNPTVSEVGIYQIQVTNTSNNCTATASVTVTENLASPIAMAATGGTIGCTNSTVILDGSGSSTGNNFIYEWTTTGTGNIAFGGTTLTPTVDNEGVYILTVTDTINNCTATASSTVDANGILPMADAGPPRSLNCEVDTIQLDGSDSSLGTGYMYEWSTNGGNIISGGDFVAPFISGGGEYTITVTDTINFCFSTSTVMVEIDTVAPIAQADQVGPLTCEDTELTLTNQNSSSGVGFSFQWMTTNGSIINATPNGDIIVNGTGTYMLTVTNEDNKCKSVDLITIEVDTIPPMANAGTDILLTCADSVINLDGLSSSVGNDFTYNWTTTNGNIISGNTTLNPEIDEDGIYLLEVVDTTNGCIMLDEVLVEKDENFPIVNAGPNGVVDCNIPEIMLSGTASSNGGGNIEIVWTTQGIGNIVSGENTLTPTVDSPGPYTMTVTNVDNQCSASDFLIVSSNLQPPTADAGVDTALICGDTVLVLDGANSSVGSDFEYLWTTSNGNIVTDSSDIDITINTGGTYELIVTNTDNGCTASDEVIVTADNTTPPIAEVQQNSNLNCYNPIVTLDGSSSIIGTNQTYEWMGNGNYVGGTNTLTPTIDSPGFYSLLITDNITGCTAQASAFILIDSMTPMATATTVGNNSITCQDNSVTLDGNGSTTGAFIIYEWTTGNGVILDIDSTQLIADVGASGDYQLLVQDTVNGCSATVLLQVGSDTIPPIADAGETMLELACDGMSVFLDGSGSSTGNDFSYTWTSTGGTVVGDPNVLNPEINGAGIYTLEVTNTSNGCIAIDQIEVTNPDEVIAVAEANVQLDCSTSSVVLNGDGSSSGQDFIYLWTTTDGNIISDETTLNPEIDEAGTYLLLVTNTQTGCTGSASVEVVFSNAFANADAGTDTSVCEDNASLSANLPAGTTGIWLTTGGAIATNPGTPNTEVTNLQEGSNIFTWTLSAPGCPEYSSDTVIIMLESMPNAVDDTYSILQNSAEFDFNTSINDDASNAMLQAISGVANGSLTPLGDGSFSYTPNENYIGTEIFDYELCSDLCPDVCDIATVTISINEIPPVDPDSVMVEYNAITPNGDGLNDVFIFDFLLTNPDQFPDNELVIFNRWGDIVYQAKPYNNDWGGTNQKGSDLPQGTYYYILRLNITERLILKGDVTILK